MTTGTATRASPDWTPLRLRRRESLFRSALELLEARGFEETTVDEIADHAAISRRSFFNYFPSKQSLLSHLHHQVTEEALAILLDQGDTRPLEAVRRSLVHFGRAMEPRHAIAGAMLRAMFTAPQLRSADLEDSRRFFPMLEERLAMARDRGTLPGGIEPSRAAGFLMSVVTGALTEWALRERVRPGELQKLLDERLGWALTGLRAAETPT